MSTEIVPFTEPVGLSSVAASPPTLFLKEARAAERFFDFFTSNIQNKHTRRAYFNAACRFSEFCAEHSVHDLAHVRPVHVAGCIENLREGFAKPTIKQHLAAIRMFFDWLVVGQIMEVNPAHAVRGPKHVVIKGRTPVSNREEARALPSSIDTGTLTGLRDRANRRDDFHLRPRRCGAADERRGLFQPRAARMGASARKRRQGTRSAVRAEARSLSRRVHRSGQYWRGQGWAAVSHDGTFHWNSTPYDAAGRLPDDSASRAPGRHQNAHRQPLDARDRHHRLPQKRRYAGAQTMAAHSSPRTTKLYDRRNDETALDEYEKVRI